MPKREVVRFAAEDAQLRLPAGAFALAPGLNAEPLAEPGPFGADHDGDRADQQRERQPAHETHTTDAKPTVDTRR